MAVVLALASGAAWPAAPAGDCGSALTGLTSCLPYISPGSIQGKPPKECCIGVKTTLASPAIVACLCDAFGKDYNISMNLTRAKGLPAACGGNPAALNNCSLKLPGRAPKGAPTEGVWYGAADPYTQTQHPRPPTPLRLPVD